MARGSAPTVELVAAQYPGREDRIAEPAVDDMDVVGGSPAESVLALMDRPVVLLGHSLGAAVGFEVARRLERDSPHRLQALFVSGRPSPDRDRVDAVHLRPDEELWQELQSLGGTNPSVLNHPELRALLLPTLRADYRLSETYRFVPGPPLECPIVACFGGDDPEVTVEEASGWGGMTSAVFGFACSPEITSTSSVGAPS